MSPSPSPAARPTVVVIGGGYAGITVAKGLDADADVILVEPRDTFVHHIGALRALVDPDFAPSIFMPLDRLLANGRVVHERAARVDADRVVLASGEELAADYVVLATGSRYPFPAKPETEVADQAVARLRRGPRGPGPGRPRAHRRGGTGRARARRRDPRRVPRRARHDPGRRRRHPRRALRARAEDRAPRAARRPRGGAPAGQPPRGPPGDRARAARALHGPHRGRRRRERGRVVPLLRRHAGQRLPRGRAGGRADPRRLHRASPPNCASRATTGCSPSATSRRPTARWPRSRASRPRSWWTTSAHSTRAAASSPPTSASRRPSRCPSVPRAARASSPARRASWAAETIAEVKGREMMVGGLAEIARPGPGAYVVLISPPSMT